MKSTRKRSLEVRKKAKEALNEITRLGIQGGLQ